MSAQGPVSGWAPVVIDFLSNNLPRDGDRGGWNHKFSTAYQIGCEALVALGYAEETDWGAVPLANSMFPNPLPRWDDICVAVLGLAEQQNKLSYRLADGSKQPTRVGWSGFTIVPPTEQRQSPVPNIASKEVLSPAHAASDLLPVLLKLGLIIDGCWADHAETVLWREQPRAWALNVSNDPRFVNSMHEAVDTLPNDVRDKIESLVVISDQDIEASVAQQQSAIEELRLTHGPKARIGRLRTPEESLRSIVFQRRNELDWIFFRRWRISDGWLTIKQAKLALEIFHDPLAIQMRRAVVGQLYPGKPEFSQ
ncbi:hypothetical protein [uncultured Thioclava sp.]|uniref:hypothetical protein n=1 Tax=uncultured Thioclava sp. TaxID=473858 RepID=UPI0025E18D18|nr:hypothetical protein [uncultured Thioclava sp.]